MYQQFDQLTTIMPSENQSTSYGPPGPPTKPWPSKVYSKDNLKPYKMYRILYGERKFARDFPKETQTLSFTDDLPTEIRLKIYAHLDLRAPDGFFELWGSTAWQRGHGRRHYSIDEYCSTIFDTFQLYAKYKHKVRLMRLCKKVHGEIAELFYGGHNFRFSCANGFQMMAAWLHNIQPTHFQYLRHITVHIPIRECDPGQADRCIWSMTKWDKFEDVQRRRGMRLPKYKYRSKDYQAGVPKGSIFYEKAATRAFRYLGSIPGLRKLELIVPRNYAVFPPGYGPYGTTLHCQKGYLEGLGPLERVRHVVEDHIGDDATWAQLEGLKAQFPDLAIALVVWNYACGLSDVDNEELRELMRNTRWLAAYAKLKGYDFGHAPWHDGAYHVQYDEDKLLVLSSTEMEDYDVSSPPDVLAVGPDDPQLPKGSALACDSAPDDED